LTILPAHIFRITNNTNFSEIGNLLSQGMGMDYIARHYHMDFPLVWALRLEGKTDQEKFKELGWGVRTWDQWNFNECDERFGDDWPGRIPAQLVAHTLFYFTKPGDLILDPMAGGGVVSDVCSLNENVNPLTSPQEITGRRSNATTGTREMITG